MFMNNNRFPDDRLLPTYELPFTTLIMFRCTRRDYAEMFRQGKLFFNTPHSWIDMAKKGNIDQGDLFEGVYCCVDASDKSDNIEKLKINPELEFFS